MISALRTTREQLGAGYLRGRELSLLTCYLPMLKMFTPYPPTSHRGVSRFKVLPQRLGNTPNGHDRMSMWHRATLHTLHIYLLITSIPI